MAASDDGKFELIAQFNGLCALFNLWYEKIEATTQIKLVAIK